MLTSGVPNPYVTNTDRREEYVVPITTWPRLGIHATHGTAQLVLPRSSCLRPPHHRTRVTPDHRHLRAALLAPDGRSEARATAPQITR